MPSKEQIIEVESLPVDIQTGATYTIKQANPNSYTHGMFKYPCKFIPEIPRWAINTYLPEKKGVVFDPFSGSGTTLLEANINGIDAFLVLIMQQIKPSLLKPTNFQHMLLRMLISRIILEVEIPVAEAQIVEIPVAEAQIVEIPVAEAQIVEIPVVETQATEVTIM